MLGSENAIKRASSLLKLFGCIDSRTDVMDSLVASALQEGQKCALSTSVSGVNGMDIRPVASVVGEGTQPYFTIIDWTRDSKVIERIRPLQPSTILSADKPYVLVGLAGDLGVSLCRLMATHGARHSVVASCSPSKAETWASEIRATSSTVYLASLDVTDIQAVRNINLELEKSCPPY
jgi:hybrid polyketide synthase/nonribosomal peptide synthetase ACE1